MKVATEYAPPIEFAALRLLLGALLLFAAMIAMRKPLRPERPWAYFWIGVFQSGGFIALATWAVMTAGAGKVSILSYTMPLWVAVLAWPLLGERLRAMQGVAVGLAALGIVLILDLWGGQSSIFADIQVDGAVESDATRVFVARENRLLGWVELGDSLRPQSAEAVARLQHDGIEVQLVSGDAERPTEAIARRLGVQRWYAHTSPEGKSDVVRELRERGRKAAFVGDGINDAPALASADVGIAMGGGTEIALETAHAAILSNDPRAVAAGVELSRATLRTIKQNLFWAFAYNAVLVPLAAFGIVHPILAAGAMGASSLFVVGNSLLLARSKR
jgi:soluble P-type ATPase/uncharacterized membrane protein